ncbi:MULTISPECIES: hypothetical protein [Thermomonas]|jgi:hypothetical protein|uniref:DUF2946 domain-containing protein n=2 Tax=Thermomonas TaxID=141948 RepID=A0A4R3NAL0_9GAMM|nr:MULTISPECIES: hypothetical protein [Thermomonas]QNN46778.1 hypothetical protein H9L17_00905 [Thermomonas brevis]TCT25707.1 hypothetical protein EDC34_10131 [Thermomonas haemolytica]TNY29743.1 hypothetical protein BV505_03865 [Thermomonas haemolytica]
MPRRVSRLVHWLVIITLIASTLVEPAQAANEALQQIAAAQMAAAMADMPCGDEMAPSLDTHEMPCDCCKPASCDLTACFGTAYLHALPDVVASVPPHATHATGNTPTYLSRSLDTLLRPPIA